VGRYSIGLDFGTESLRALLLDLDSGEELAEGSFRYPDGVIAERLPCKEATPLGADWFLQNPQDYLAGLEKVVPGLLERAGVDGAEVVGIGMDFTACTMMPTDAEGTPLCMKEQFRGDPQAWVKLWKHHGASAEAERIATVARQRKEKFLRYYAGVISSEWFMPKALETLNRSPQVYEAADTFIEGADWVAWQLTGQLARNACCAGYKAQYVAGLGWPSREFLEAVHPRLGGLFEEKVRGPIVSAGTAVGGLSEQWAAKLGLRAGTPLSAGMIDAHAGVAGCGVTEPGTMVLVLGTSFCHMMPGDKEVFFEGLAGMVKDGIVPGYYGYESGQTAGGDIYAWFVNNCAPPEYHEAARSRGIGIHDLLSAEARKLKPGQSGLLALDWLNGNRSILMDSQLSGMLLGITLNTNPEEMYRALIEGTAFGTRRILQAYEEAGVHIGRLIACGGLPEQNPFVMQVFADVCNMPIHVAASSQAMGLASAMFGAVAAGKQRGGFDSIREAASSIVKPPRAVYRPDPQAAPVYDELYREYAKLHDYFGRQERIMHRLRAIKQRQRQ